LSQPFKQCEQKYRTDISYLTLALNYPLCGMGLLIGVTQSDGF